MARDLGRILYLFLITSHLCVYDSVYNKFISRMLCSILVVSE